MGLGFLSNDTLRALAEQKKYINNKIQDTSKYINDVEFGAKTKFNQMINDKTGNTTRDWLYGGVGGLGKLIAFGANIAGNEELKTDMLKMSKQAQDAVIDKNSLGAALAEEAVTGGVAVPGFKIGKFAVKPIEKAINVLPRFTGQWSKLQHAIFDIPKEFRGGKTMRNIYRDKIQKRYKNISNASGLGAATLANETLGNDIQDYK